MYLGFYYHIPIRKDGDQLFTAGYLGCFLDAIAEQVGCLTLFMHSAEINDVDMDYALSSPNIKLVSLGEKPRPEVRTFLGNRIVAPAFKLLAECDVMLVRAPSHLFAAWGKLCDRQNVQMIPLLVGDYRAGNAGVRMPFPKKQAVQFLNWYVSWRERAYLRGKSVFVNSSILAEKYRSIAREVQEVRTTTLSATSFFERGDTCIGKTVNLLYAGRFDWQKGVQELVDAFMVLVKRQGVDAMLHFVGWQDGRGPSIEKAILKQVDEHGLSNRIVFHGKKAVGPELNAVYRMADIYVLPSFAEGFPRTIWEAMANSLPVIATKVGSIPDYLTDKTHALLIPPRDVGSLTSAISCILNNMDLRVRLISEGRKLAENNTLERQAEKIVNLLKEKVQ